MNSGQYIAEKKCYFATADYGKREQNLLPLTASASGEMQNPLNYTARRLRPFARRAANTARPPRVFERTRKPWVRLRRVTDGW